MCTKLIKVPLTFKYRKKSVLKFNGIKIHLNDVTQKKYILVFIPVNSP